MRSFRLGGVKIFLDGSPQARTAWVTQPYLGGTGQERGYPSMKDEQVADALRAATRAGAQLLAHCNGDAAAEQFLRAVAQVEREQLRLRSLRPVMIHAQLLRRQQLARLAELGVIASFFIAHIYHWGEVHVRNLGRDRAAVISPAGSALRERLTFTFHQDAPVIAPDMLETLFCACVRQSRAGEILGADERIAAVDALRAVTCNAAYQYFGGRGKGRPRARQARGSFDSERRPAGRRAGAPARNPRSADPSRRGDALPRLTNFFRQKGANPLTRGSMVWYNSNRRVGL